MACILQILFFKNASLKPIKKLRKLAIANNFSTGHRLAIQDVNAQRNIILGHGRHIIFITRKKGFDFAPFSYAHLL